MVKPKVSPRLVYDDDGTVKNVVLSKKDFEKLIDVIEDYHDYRLVKKMGPVDLKKGIPFEVIEKKLADKAKKKKKINT